MASKKIGKVVNYDTYVGDIVATDGKYQFQDISTIGEINVGDVVIFSGEIHDGQKKAFFVENFNNALGKTTNSESRKLSKEHY